MTVGVNQERRGGLIQSFLFSWKLSRIHWVMSKLFKILDLGSSWDSFVKKCKKRISSNRKKMVRLLANLRQAAGVQWASGVNWEIFEGGCFLYLDFVFISKCFSDFPPVESCTQSPIYWKHPSSRRETQDLTHYFREQWRRLAGTYRQNGESLNGQTAEVKERKHWGLTLRLFNTIKRRVSSAAVVDG